MNYNEWLDTEYQKWIDGLQAVLASGNLEDASQLPLVKVPDLMASVFQYEGNATQRRYKHYANKIYHRFDRFNKSTVLEIGAGYGGLCKEMHALPYGLIKDYYILDLPEVVEFQKVYLKDVPNLHFGVPDEIDFLISCYCIGELKPSDKTEYIQKYVSKAKRGFIIWNPAFAPDNIGLEMIRYYHPFLVVKEENPKTGPYNLQLTW